MSAPLDFDAIQARADAATEGPWRAERHIDFPSEPGYLIYMAPADGSEFGTAGDVGWTTNQQDAEFTANARTVVPQLLAEVTRLRAERDAVEQDTEYRRITPHGQPVWGVTFDEMPELDAGWSAESRKVAPWMPVHTESINETMKEAR